MGGQVAHAAKGFVVEKSGSDNVLITDGYSEYVIEHDYDCYSSDFYEGATIYIDTSYSPSYGDKIIIPGYSSTVCEVTSSEDVNIKRYYVDEVFDSEDKIIVTDKYNDQFLVEYGLGCGLSMWRYEGKTIDVDIGGSFLDGIGDQIYLFDSGRDCKIWDAEELSGSSGVYSGGSPTYAPPITTTSCPANSSYVGSQCTCNSGYSANGSTCVSYTQSCQAANNNDAKIVGTKDSTGKINCNCTSGYTWNGASCVSYVQTPPPAQSTNIDTGPQMTQDERCVKLNFGTFYNTDKQGCDTCPSGTMRVSGTNNCQKPIPVVKKDENAPAQSTSVVKTPDVKKIVSNKISTTSRATSSPSIADSPTSKSRTFWQKVTSPFKSFWGRIFK